MLSKFSIISDFKSVKLLFKCKIILIFHSYMMTKIAHETDPEVRSGEDKKMCQNTLEI
jgi:hypothetical protein